MCPCPPEIFDHIMYFLGSTSSESIDICRLVCRDWNEKIMSSLWKKPTKKWGAIIGSRFEGSWDVSLPTEEKVNKALELKAGGILNSDLLEKLAEKLRNIIAFPSTLESASGDKCRRPVSQGTAGPCSVAGAAHAWSWYQLGLSPCPETFFPYL